MKRLDEIPQLAPQSESFSVHSAEFKAAAASSWYARMEMGYVIIRYAQCAALLREPRLAQGSAAVLALRGVTQGPLVDWWTGTILNLSGASHTRLRRLVAKAFTPPMVEKLRPFFRSTAERLVDAVPDSGKVDFVASFSEPFPLEGICEMLGIPQERRAAFFGYAADLGLIFSTRIGEPAFLQRAEDALAALYACADEVIADRRARPADDLVTALVQAEAEGERLSQQELRVMIVGLIFAGNDTTRNQLGLGAIAFAEHPDQWSILRANPKHAPRAVDEMMRLHPTISMTTRIATEDVEYQGVVFQKGTILRLLFAGANVDSDVFGDGDFDITIPRETPHLGFSGGIHRCLGVWLAKAEMEEALLVLSRRYARIDRDGVAEWQTGLGIDGPTTLPLRFSVGA